MNDDTPRGLTVRLRRRQGAAWGPGSGVGREATWKRRLPALADIERAARRRLPRFAYDFLAGGTGDDLGVRRNRAALDAVEIVPRYGELSAADTTTSLFGRRYAAPIGISPAGLDGLAWPDATRLLADTAHAADLPYITGTLASASIEEVARRCGDRAWFQLYGIPADGHKVTFDLVSRAEAAGATTLVVAVDAPVRSKRPRDLRHGLVVPFRPTLTTALQVAGAPAWALAALRSRVPVFANMGRYVAPPGRPATLDEVAGFVQRELRGGFTWDEIAELRQRWPRALVIKGILHPADAERAVRAGADGVLVSNHGGRQSDAAPAAIDVLPAVARAVGGDATVLFDSGVRSGLDVSRAIALGADAAFSGRGFLLGLAAAGRRGGDYVAALLTDELRTAMGQFGVDRPERLRTLDIRHATAWNVEPGLII
ncbi:alpha-hydroxy-acid oxidizing protein [Streptomyces sp. SID8361]|uniref:alpha-hydroxy acid oxidase n=1 Tax=Streptomyces sp. MnatMP-M27 TaxID=1839768 RepID=UPI00081F6052|nr:alpha-hydroxy acid oxidase [Streptomyces sp. MnatMP-M27]MYU16411.1 alpha-hydroxy-acid oxidizing protein [Streptomyces sp. SID8361]SCG10980.1 L-lactate dehydrogenase (cytochrome) [Streptomyces sp. MnatMP-M27]